MNKWEDWCDNFDNFDCRGDEEIEEKLRAEAIQYVDEDSDMYTLLTEGGVYIRKDDTMALNMYEYIAVHIGENGNTFFEHSFVDLNDYLEDDEFIQYAEEEGMTPEGLAKTGTFAASWVLENNVEYVYGEAMEMSEIAARLYDLGVFEKPEHRKDKPREDVER